MMFVGGACHSFDRHTMTRRGLRDSSRLQFSPRMRWYLSITSILSLSLVRSMSTSHQFTTQSPVQVCVLGGGVSGCAAASSLLSSSFLSVNPNQGKTFERVALIEMGRGVGGRASTRLSRDDSRVQINHGAPHADIRTEEGRAMMIKLQELGFTKPSSLIVSADDNDAEQVEYWTGEPSMNRVSKGLLDPLPTQPSYMFQTMVREVQPIVDGGEVLGWRVLGKDGTLLLETEWLVVSGSAIAHPRWTAAFGGEPPLVTAAKELGNEDLERTLQYIASTGAKPVQAALMAYDVKDTTNVSKFFHSAQVIKTPNDPVLEKLVIQKSDDGSLVSVVAHSSAAFAETAKDTYGSKSTAARVGGATSSTDREQEVLGALMNAVERTLELETDAEEECLQPIWGPFLHRWGNAFPTGTGVQFSDAIVSSAKIAFCGDYVGGSERFGTFEGGLLSGFEIGRQLKRLI